MWLMDFLCDMDALFSSAIIYATFGASSAFSCSSFYKIRNEIRVSILHEVDLELRKYIGVSFHLTFFVNFRTCFLKLIIMGLFTLHSYICLWFPKRDCSNKVTMYVEQNVPLQTPLLRSFKKLQNSDYWF